MTCVELMPLVNGEEEADSLAAVLFFIETRQG